MEPTKEEQEEGEADLNVEDVIDEEDKEQYKKAIDNDKAKYIKDINARIEEMKQKKEVERETAIMLEDQEMKEEKSGIVLRSKRQLSNVELAKVVDDKTYVDLDSIEKTISPEMRTTDDYYTIGILCQRFPIKKSKSNVPFLTLKFSTLRKKTELMSGEGADATMKSGYKLVTVFVYGEPAKQFVDEDLGEVFAIMAPSAMPRTDEHSYALKLTGTPQLVKVGMALYFDMCKYYIKALGRRCSNFVNVFFDNYCEQHMHAKIDKIKARSSLYQSEYVDLNQVRTENKSLLSLGAGPRKRFEESVQMSKDTKVKFEKFQAEESGKLNAFMKRRNETAGKSSNQLHKMLADKARANLRFRATSKKGAEGEVDLELDGEEEVNTDFIKKLMEKKKQTFSEKFGTNGGADAQEAKRSKPQ